MGGCDVTSGKRYLYYYCTPDNAYMVPPVLLAIGVAQYYVSSDSMIIQAMNAAFLLGHTKCDFNFLSTARPLLTPIFCIIAFYCIIYQQKQCY